MTLFVVDVSINWATDRIWQIKVHDAWKVTQLTFLRQKGVKVPAEVFLRDWSAQTIRTCCLAEMEVADDTFYLTRSEYTDTGPTSPSADPIKPSAWQGSHWITDTGMTRPGERSTPKAGNGTQVWRSRGGRLNH